MVQLVRDPSSEQVVDDREGQRGSHGIVREDIADDGDFRRGLDVGADEAPKDRREGAFVGPFDEGVK